MAKPKPITLETVAPEEYEGRNPKPFVVVGDIPGAGGGVDSVNGQTGAVTLSAGDVDALPDSYVPAWGDVTGKPSTFPPAAHTHDIADVSGLQAIIDDYETRIAALEAAQP